MRHLSFRTLKILAFLFPPNGGVRADFLRDRQAELGIARRLDGGNRRTLEVRSNLDIYRAQKEIGWVCASREWSRGERIMRWIWVKLNPFI